MLEGASWSLMAAAAAVALIHTLLGPDHYLPFIMLARARGWTTGRTVTVTTVCGLGHVASSLALGSLGVLGGVAVARLEQVEGGRGSLAAWGLVAFGLAYAIWGARKALRRAGGLEPHSHEGRVHLHRHGDKHHDHAVVHAGNTGGKHRAAFWSLFAIFVLGPCEPLIPLFVLPASRGRWDQALGAAAVFALVTIGTMVGATLLGLMGLRPLRLNWMERWSHTLAGGVIAMSGLAILVLGL